MSGWEVRDQTSYRVLHNEWIARDSWIIDGVGFWEELLKRLALSDLVIYYDVPVPICLQRARQRIKAEKLSPNTDITEGCCYQDVHERQIDVIHRFEADLKPKILRILNGMDQTRRLILGPGEESQILEDLVTKNIL